MISLGLLCEDKNVLRKAQLVSSEHGKGKLLAHVIGKSLEIYSYYVSVLLKKQNKKKFSLSDFRNECELLSQSFASLYGVQAWDIANPKRINTFIEVMQEYNYFYCEKENIILSQDFSKVVESASHLVSYDLRESIFNISTTEQKS